jgi:hypothetical protein
LCYFSDLTPLAAAVRGLLRKGPTVQTADSTTIIKSSNCGVIRRGPDGHTSSSSGPEAADQAGPVDPRALSCGAHGAGGIFASSAGRPHPDRASATPSKIDCRHPDRARRPHGQPADAASGHRKSKWRSRTMAKKLEKQQWRPYFDRMSKALVGKRAEIEIASLQLGDEIEAEWLPLIGITYDPKDDIIEVALEGVDHLINKPREVWVEEDGPVLSRLEIIDADGARQIVVFRDPLMLPAPSNPTAKAG